MKAQKYQSVKQNRFRNREQLSNRVNKEKWEIRKNGKRRNREIDPD